MVTIKEASDAISVGRTSLYADMKEGRLKWVPYRRGRRITVEELKRYVASLSAGHSPGG